MNASGLASEKPELCPDTPLVADTNTPPLACAMEIGDEPAHNGELYSRPKTHCADAPGNSFDTHLKAVCLRLIHRIRAAMLGHAQILRSKTRPRRDRVKPNTPRTSRVHKHG